MMVSEISICIYLQILKERQVTRSHLIFLSDPFFSPILQLCIRHDVSLPESNPKIWENEVHLLGNYPTH